MRARFRTAALMEVFKACKEGRLDEVRKLLGTIDTSAVRPSLKDDKGWSPLHYACQNGHATVVDLLLQHDYDPQIVTSRDRDTPLHLACANAHTQVVSLLIGRISRLRKNRSGNNPLHLACKVGCIEIVKALLEAFPDGAYTKNVTDTTPFGYAVKNGHKAIVNLLLQREGGNPTGRFSDFSSLFSSFDAKLSLDPPVSIFVVGDRQCGKSTLIKSLHQETPRERFWGISVNTTGVDEHRVGLVPTDFRSRKLGRILFHDLASGRDCIHTDLIRSRADIELSIFIIVIDFRNEREEMEDKMAFWMNFIYNQCAKYWSPQSKPSVAVVGSFWDVQKPFRLTNSHRLLLAYNSVCSAHEELAARFNLLQKYSLDCRKSESPNMRQLRSALKKRCERKRPPAGDVPSQCFILSSVLERELVGAGVPAVQVSDLASKISEKASSPQITLFTFLPLNMEDLLQLCRILQERRRVLLLKTNSSDSNTDTWIVHGLHTFVTLIDNALGVLRELPATAQPVGPSGSHAIMTQESLMRCLNSIPLDFQLLGQLLRFFRVGIAVELTTTIGLNADHYFPSLLPTKYAFSPWDPKDRRYSFGFAWSFVPVVDQECQFFLPHFLKFLLLRLISKRAHSDFDKYTVWSHGMHCSMHDALEVFVIVSVDSRTITLSMRCKPGYEFACLRFRNQILNDIREVKENTQRIEVDEFVTPLCDGSCFPVQQPGSDRHEKNIADLKQALIGDSRDPNSLATFKSLFFLEPYLFIKKLSKEQLHLLTDPKHASRSVGEEFLIALAECFGDMWQGIAEHLDLHVDGDTSTEGSEKVSTNSDPQTPTEGESLTYGDLINRLSSISVYEAGLKAAMQVCMCIQVLSLYCRLF